MTETSAGEEGGPSYKRISDADYAAAKEKYELGTHGLTELADAIGCSRQALGKRFKDDGVTRGSRAGEVAAAAKTEVAAAVVERFADKRNEWIEQTRISGYNLIKQGQTLLNKELADAIKAGHAIATREDNLKTIARYIKSTIEATEARLRVLNADDVVNEDDLPSLAVEDLTDADIIQHHRAISGDNEVDVDELLEHVHGQAEEFGKV